MTNTNNTLNPEEVSHSFSRAAASYDSVAQVQKVVGERLLQRLDYIKLKPKRILDLGCGTGYFIPLLRQKFPEAEIIALDNAAHMVSTAQQQLGDQDKLQFLTANCLNLPLENHSIDFIFSNMMLHWLNNNRSSFDELARVLSPEGLLLLTMAGPDTLGELREAWRRVDPYPHVHDFTDMHDVGDALMASRFSDPVVDMEKIKLTYTDIFQLMRDLKLLGARNIHPQRRRGLTGKQLIKQLEAEYEPYREQGKLPLTYEIIYGLAWGSGVTNSEQGTEVSIPIANLRRMIGR